MNSSKHDCQITVQQRSITQDPDDGTDIVGWVPLVAAAGSPVIGERWWAEVQDVMPSKAEAVRSGVANARQHTRVRMRYRSDIDATMRIIVHRDTDVVYQIIAGPAQIGGRKDRIEFVCEHYTTEAQGA